MVKIRKELLIFDHEIVHHLFNHGIPIPILSDNQLAFGKLENISLTMGIKDMNLSCTFFKSNLLRPSEGW